VTAPLHGWGSRRHRRPYAAEEAAAGRGADAPLPRILPASRYALSPPNHHQTAIFHAPPPDFLYDYYSVPTFTWTSDTYTYDAAPGAIGAAVEVSRVDQTHKVLECLLPWRMFVITP
jgi:hypothetical protein